MQSLEDKTGETSDGNTTASRDSMSHVVNQTLPRAFLQNSSLSENEMDEQKGKALNHHWKNKPFNVSY